MVFLVPHCGLSGFGVFVLKGEVVVTLGVLDTIFEVSDYID